MDSDFYGCVARGKREGKRAFRPVPLAHPWPGTRWLVDSFALRNSSCQKRGKGLASGGRLGLGGRGSLVHSMRREEFQAHLAWSERLATGRLDHVMQCTRYRNAMLGKVMRGKAASWALLS